MFGNLKRKFHSVLNEGISLSDSLPSLGISNTLSALSVSTTSLETNPVPNVSGIDFHAGHTIVAKNESDWYDLHLLNEENATRAETVHNQICTIKHNVERSSTFMHDINSTLQSLPVLIQSLKESKKLIESINMKHIKLEEKMNELQDIIESEELQSKQLDQKLQLSVYQEKKLVALEKFRLQLAEEHSAKVKKREEDLLNIQKERQAVFQEAFQQDLNNFRQNGEIPKIQSLQHRSDHDITLEEVVLDNRDDTALDEFLNS